MSNSQVLIRCELSSLLSELEEKGFLKLTCLMADLRLYMLRKDTVKRRGRPKKEKKLGSVEVEDKIGELLASLNREDDLGQDDDLCVMRVTLEEKGYLKSGCGRVFDGVSQYEILDIDLVRRVLEV
jgi:hypothetical protein